MTFRKKRTKLRPLGVSMQNIPLSLLALALFFLLGVAVGYAAAARYALTSGEELRRYIEGFVALASRREVSLTSMIETFLCFFRAPTVVFLLGFASLGVILIPLVCAMQGFLFSFSLFCFSSALGREGFWLLLVLFGVRLFLVLPCTLLLGSRAWATARDLAAFSLGGGKRVKGVSYGSRYWTRFGVSCVCLCLGAALELWLVPRLVMLLA